MCQIFSACGFNWIKNTINIDESFKNLLIIRKTKMAPQTHNTRSKVILKDYPIKNISDMFGINPFQVTAPFLPPENTKKSEVFSCFQEVKRGALV